jgi:hypothetical protein
MLGGKARYLMSRATCELAKFDRAMKDGKLDVEFTVDNLEVDDEWVITFDVCLDTELGKAVSTHFEIDVKEGLAKLLSLVRLLGATLLDKLADKIPNPMLKGFLRWIKQMVQEEG